MSLIGIGLYTPSEAALLLHEKPRTVRRWAFGYPMRRGGRSVQHPALIRTELPAIQGQRALTFVELVELLYVRAFQRAGVSWATIREASRVAALLYCSEHPFALRQLYADPGSLYGGARESDGSESLVQLVGHGQHVFPELLRPYLAQLEFGGDDVARRWWPLGRTGGVVLDPRFSFGAPIVEEVGIQARVLAETFEAEEPFHGEATLDHVAWTFDVHPRHVQTARTFQRWLTSPRMPSAA